MSSRTANLDPLGELRLVAEPQPDRLPAMLFLAALFHGILILGVSFNPSLLDDFADAISLEVTIVADPDQRIDRPDDAEPVLRRAAVATPGSPSLGPLAGSTDRSSFR